MNNVNIISVNLSEMAAGTHLLWQAPTDAQGGGVTILGGAINGGGTVTAALHTFSSAATPALNGTIAAATGGTLSATVPSAFTIADGWVDGGEWVGVVLAGTLLDATCMHLKYVMGR